MMEGIFVALAIPFKNGKLDEESLARHVDSLTKAGVDGFYHSAQLARDHT